jgi:hypothetical protein
LLSAAQFAAMLQVPVPLVMVTTAPNTVHAPDALITGALLALVVGETANLEL